MMVSMLLLYFLQFIAAISTVIGRGGGEGALVVAAVVAPALRHAENEIKKIDG